METLWALWGEGAARGMVWEAFVPKRGTTFLEIGWSKLAYRMRRAQWKPDPLQRRGEPILTSALATPLQDRHSESPTRDASRYSSVIEKDRPAGSVIICWNRG